MVTILVNNYFSDFNASVRHFNRQPKFEIYSMCYKRVRKLAILCWVNEAFVYILNVKVKILGLTYKECAKR